jgi:hypothetical protein
MEVPTAAEYRLRADEIDTTVCVGRRIKGGEDKRWTPFVYRESQCGRPFTEGSDLCARCAAKEAKYLADPNPRTDWTGRITEEPLAWVHMLGTEWAAGKKPKFITLAPPPPLPAAAPVLVVAAAEDPIKVLLGLAETVMDVLKIDRTPATRAKFIAEFLAFCYR